METESKNLFLTDRPIQRSSEDQLNRSKFSRDLAQSLSKWSEKDSLVVAIYGRWGDGKTSVKNMVKEFFEKENSPLYIEFNPWQWASEKKLTEAFFKELAVKLRASENENERAIAEKLIYYSEYLELGNEFVGELKKGVEKILLLGVGGVGALSLFATEPYKSWLIYVTVTLSLVALGLDKIIWIINWVSRLYNLRARDEKSLEDRKQEIVGDLSKIESTLVVFIDDIDRLSKDEIKTLFRLIKANADFPNIVYLTLFQRDIVESSLTQEGVFEGKDYLEKIVQVGFNLPKVPTADIHKLLFNDLDRILDETKLNSKFDKARWRELFLEGASSCFKNLRDVNRFISAFSFHLGVMKIEDSYEINFVDLIGIEVLRQFFPKVHEAIFFSKKLMTSSSSAYSLGNMQESAKKEMDSILASCSADDIESVKGIIKILFPNAEWAWGSNYHCNVNASDFVNLRVNDEDRFDRYFSLFLPESEIRQSEFEHILSITSNEQELSLFFLKYHEQGRLDLFMEKFESYKQEINKEDAIPFISAILKCGDLLSDEREGFMGISPLTHVSRIVHWYFKKDDFTEEEKAEIYWQILEKSDAIYMTINLLWDEVDRRSIEKYPDHYILKNYEVDKIKGLLLKKISEFKNRPDFESSIHLARIIWTWMHVDKEAAQNWLNEYVKDDLKLLEFLISLENRGSISSGYEVTYNYYIQLLYLKQFFDDIPALAERVRKLKSLVKLDGEKANRVFENVDRAEDQHLHPDKYSELKRMGMV